MPEETVPVGDMVNCDCQPCRKKRGESHLVRAGIIHDYSSEPARGWVPRRTSTEAANSPTFGVELETDAPQHRYRDLPGRPFLPYLPYNASPTDIAQYRTLERQAREYDRRNNAHHEEQRRRFAEMGDMTAAEAVSMAQPRGFWHAKHDGSVTGPEFASQPASLAYWRAQRANVTGMFKALLHGGMRSHDGDRCGLHVNIGNDAFSGPSGTARDARHLERFMTLVTVNRRWAVRMAQRTHNSADQWASAYGIDSPERRRTICDQWAAYGSAGTGHGCAVNVGNEGRVEFRLPRGTLRVDRFYAKLEWVASMVEYTRDPDNAANVAAYVRWVQDRSGEYPYLIAMMRERFAARFERPSVETAAVTA